MDNYFTASIEIEAPASVEMDEREQGPDGGAPYNSKTLVDVKNHQSHFSVGVDDDDDDDDAICFRMSAFHAKDKETERAFHSRVEIVLTRRQAARVRDFLSFLLD